MSDAPKKRLRAWIGWALVSILALYFLSAGPAFRLWSDGYIGSRIVNGVYAPLDWAYDHSTAVQRITDRYMRIWAPSDP
jgi:hypothetical protein